MDYLLILILGVVVGMFVISLFSINVKDNDEVIKEFKKRKKRGENKNAIRR